MTAPDWIEKMIKEHGLPTNMELYRAILDLTFSQGRMAGTEQFSARLLANMKALDAAAGVQS